MNKIQIKKYTILFQFLICLFVYKGTAQVGAVTNSADANAVLDLSNTSKKGLLLPKVALSGTNNPAPLSANLAGMHVYNTAESGTGTYKVTPGEYYNDGSKWVRFSSSSWGVNGNTGTDPANDKIGTNDMNDLVFRTNNVERMRLTTSGNLLVGSRTVPAGAEKTKLSINSNLKGALQMNTGGNYLTGTFMTYSAIGTSVWSNPGNSTIYYVNSAVLQTFNGNPVASGTPGPGTTGGTILKTTAPISITSNGSYRLTLKWLGYCDGGSTVSNGNISAYIQLLKNGVVVDETEYCTVFSGGSSALFTFNLTMFAMNCVPGDVLTFRIHPAMGDESTNRNWYSGYRTLGGSNAYNTKVSLVRMY